MTIPTQTHPAFLTSYPPRRCGIATFSADLRQAVAAEITEAPPVLAVHDGGRHRYGPEVVARLRAAEPEDYRRLAEVIDAAPLNVLSLQHEFGLFGGRDGEAILSLLERVRTPVVTTLHTVLRDPGDHRRAIIRGLADRSATLVVIARSAVQILDDVYGVDPTTVRHVPHGIPPPARISREEAKRRCGLTGQTVLSTFGLLGPGKGIEYALDALPPIVRKHPDVIYLVLGKTHPGERRHAGEAYRSWLHDRITALGLRHHVRLLNRYLTDAEIRTYLTATDVYLTPYVGAEQISSGTVAYALGAGRVIVATPFPYAREVLAGGRGVLVPFRNAPAIARTLRRLLADPQQRSRIEERARTAGLAMRWPQVARSYVALFATAADNAAHADAVHAAVGT